MFPIVFYEQRRLTANLARNQRPVADMHRQIYQAIRDRDRERAEKYMSEHLLVAEREQDAERSDEGASANAAADGDRRIRT